MTTRNTIALIVSLLVLVALILWLTIARIIESTLPPLINNETVRIETLIVSSIGLHQSKIAQISGYA